MGCTGGCINGGGQPIHSAKIQDTVDISALRTDALYDIDIKKKHRESRTNKLLMRMYKDWLGEPNSELAHNLLHTTYKERKFYK
jgi:NADP-reducing hydrogenase subunit HndD